MLYFLYQISADVMSQYYVGCALANLSCAVGNHAIMVEQGGLQPLITLAYASDPDVHQQAAAALRGLSVSTENKMKVVQEGGLLNLDKIISVGRRGDPPRGLRGIK